MTSMPPLFPVMPIMAVELAVYGLAVGFNYKKVFENDECYYLQLKKQEVL